MTARLKTSEPAKRVLRPLVLPPMRAYIRHAPGSFGKAGIWNHVLAHTWWLETTAVADTDFGARLHVDGRDIVGRYLRYFAVWEPNLTALIRERLGPGDVFVDVGANLGYFSLLASGLVGETGRVVALEVMPSIFDVLERNIEENMATNVRAVNEGAWDSESELTLFAEGDGLAGTATLFADNNDRWQRSAAGTVRVRPLSEILQPEEVAAARFIKIDVEGAEWQVLEGLLPVLEEMRPDLELAVEVSPALLAQQGHTSDDLLGLLGQQGFHAYLLENDYAAAAYLRGPVKRPARLERIAEDRETVDLVFSRIDAEML
jgi:FkbM family methyltransferase